MKPMRIDSGQIAVDIRAIGIGLGDIVLVRASLKPIGRLADGAKTVVQALLDAVGPNGTIVSLAFTHSAFMRRASPTKAFTRATPTYAGALPQAMLDWPGSVRSRHPTCSYVAIGPASEELLRSHDAHAGAYAPIRGLLGRNAVGLLIGCVDSSPGFTTAHLAEVDLGLHRRVIAPWANSSWYYDQSGKLKLFRRPDHGLCSIGFRNFYSHYTDAGILRAGRVGNAYSIALPLAGAYAIEKKLLEHNPRFAICGEPDCLICNARRWDRVHRMPLFALKRLSRYVFGRHSKDRP